MLDFRVCSFVLPWAAFFSSSWGSRLRAVKPGFKRRPRPGTGVLLPRQPTVLALWQQCGTASYTYLPIRVLLGFRAVRLQQTGSAWLPPLQGTQFSQSKPWRATGLFPPSIALQILGLPGSLSTLPPRTGRALLAPLTGPSLWRALHLDQLVFRRTLAIPGRSRMLQTRPGEISRVQQTAQRWSRQDSTLTCITHRSLFHPTPGRPGA
jgi:hypothetical protein